MRRRIRLAMRGLAIALGAAALAGCSSGARRQVDLASLSPFHAAQPPAVATALDASFLPEPARMAPNSRYPFQVSWVQPGIDFHNYSAVMLAPVSLEHLAPPAPDSGGNISVDNKAAALDAAIFAGDAFARAVQDDPAHRFTAVARPDAKTIVVEMAIVELTPNHQPASADAFGIPTFASAASALTLQTNKVGRGTIAMELALRDGRTNQVIAMFADTRRAPLPPGDQKLAPGFGFADQIVGDWMRQTAAMLKS